MVAPIRFGIKYEIASPHICVKGEYSNHFVTDPRALEYVKDAFAQSANPALKTAHIKDGYVYTNSGEGSQAALNEVKDALSALKDILTPRAADTLNRLATIISQAANFQAKGSHTEIALNKAKLDEAFANVVEIPNPTAASAG